MFIEFLKLLKQKYFIFIVFSIIVFSLAINVFYSYNNGFYPSDYGIDKYEDSDELEERIDNLYESKDRLLDGTYTQSALNYINEQILIHEFILENDIEYGSFITFDSIASPNTRDYYGYIIGTVSSSTLVLLVALCFLFLILFNMDFLNGAYRFLYQRAERRTVLKSKIGLYFILSLVLIASVMLLIVLDGLIMFGGAEKLDLIFIYQGSVYKLGAGIFTLLAFLSWLTFLLFYILAFITASLLFTNIFIAFTVDLLFACITLVLNTSPLNILFSDVFTGQILSHSYSAVSIILCLAIKSVVMLLAAYFSYKRFLRIDIK